MKKNLVTTFVMTFIVATNVYAMSKPLKSWNDPYREKIIDYVESVACDEGGDCISPEDRVAVFDLDGTLLAEKPHSMEAALTNKRLMEKLSKNPALIKKRVYRVVKYGERGYFKDINNILGKIAEAFVGETQEFYMNYISDFYRNYKNPKYGKPYGRLVYKPMIELIDYLAANGFKNYVCSGSQQMLVRLMSKELHIPEENLIGTAILFKYSTEKGKSVLRMADKAVLPSANTDSKPFWIFERTGKRPVFAAANSYKDKEMLSYVSDSKHKSFVMVVNHDDKEREAFKGRPRLFKLAKEKNWMNLSMKKGFREIFFK